MGCCCLVLIFGVCCFRLLCLLFVCCCGLVVSSVVFALILGFTGGLGYWWCGFVDMIARIFGFGFVLFIVRFGVFHCRFAFCLAGFVVNSVGLVTLWFVCL